MEDSRDTHRNTIRQIVDTPGRIGLLVYVVLSATLIIVDHRRHLLGWLPWLLILAFPALALLVGSYEKVAAKRMAARGRCPACSESPLECRCAHHQRPVSRD